jgi:hypothetical protein
MRKIWKYIGILLMINWGFGYFTFESSNKQSTVSDVDNYKDLDDCAQHLDPIKKPRDIKSFKDILIQSNFGAVQHAEQGELYLQETQGKKLPLGIFYRFSSF